MYATSLVLNHKAAVSDDPKIANTTYYSEKHIEETKQRRTETNPAHSTHKKPNRPKTTLRQHHNKHNTIKPKHNRCSTETQHQAKTPSKQGKKNLRGQCMLHQKLLQIGHSGHDSLSQNGFLHPNTYPPNGPVLSQLFPDSKVGKVVFYYLIPSFLGTTPASTRVNRN